MQFKLRNPMAPFICLCNVWKMLKNAFELYLCTSIFDLQAEERNVDGISQAFFVYIKLTFSILVHLNVFYYMYSGFSENYFFF